MRNVYIFDKNEDYRNVPSVLNVIDLCYHYILKTLYFSLVESYINYGLVAWGNSVHINKVFKLQKRAIRIVCKAS